MRSAAASRFGFLALAALWSAASAAGAFWLATGAHDRVVATMLVLALPYGAASWWVLRRGRDLDDRLVLAVILGTAVLARIVLLPSPPFSTDVYRYVWDGRVQGAGINPYRFMPADPALERLRDRAIYPNINRAATAVTIYPPAAEGLFYLVTRVADGVTAMKAALVLIELAGIWALLRLLAAYGLPRNRVLLYAWHPLPLFEFAGSGHIDAAAIACMLFALSWAHRRRPGLAGAALALGAGLKYFPAFIAPAVWRPLDWRLPTAFAATLVVLYLPYVLGVGAGVLGYLPGYVQEEKFTAAGGVVWLAFLDRLGPMPAWLPSAYVACAGALLLVLGAAIAWRHRAGPVAPAAALVLLAAFTLAATPHYPWYFTWTVPLLCLRPSLALTWLTASAPFLYGAVWPYDPVLKQALIYVPFLAILAAELLLVRRARSPREIQVDRHLGPQPTA